MQTNMQYGNASAECVYWSSQGTFLENLFSDFIQQPVGLASGQATKNELVEIQDYVLQLGKNEELKRRYCNYDRNLMQWVSAFTFEHNDELTAKYKELVKQLFMDALPLICKLKLHFQRPRPFQLAHLHKLEIFPHASLSANCPAFPSMHGCMGYLFKEVLGNLLPETYLQFKNLSEDLYYSRLYMGVCLPSDVNAGRILAEKIVAEKEFKLKYRI